MCKGSFQAKTRCLSCASSLPSFHAAQPVCPTPRSAGNDVSVEKKSANACAPCSALPLRIVALRRKYVRFAGVTGIISSSYDVFANAQRIVKVKEAKSEQRTVMKSLHPIFDYESLAAKPRSGAAEAAECAVFARLAIRWPNAALIS
ncbi:hypothetical protein I5R53_04215 [Serratia ureilytica]|uniref:Uncharacterized protein n=1 Tax=Serratia ureilytica TaxID=300181 RepID=A0A9X9C664_9GAMM|nr:hypothetical protein [Serratia ureilytica]MBH3265948.1 hypothetical protein [Serratia ureilytica]TXE32889.1 hypothetical protein FOT63_02195 [Serratia ureilytica]